MKVKKLILATGVALVLSHVSFAQTIEKQIHNPVLITSENVGSSKLIESFDFKKVNQQLKSSPLGQNLRSVNDAAQVTLTIDGQSMVFDAIENHTMSAEYKSNFPELRSYTLQSGTIRARATSYPGGLYLTMYTKQGVVSIYPDHNAQGQHRIDYGKVNHHPHQHHGEMCSQHGSGEMPKLDPIRMKQLEADVTNGTELRTYRMAIVGTGEYWEANGSTTLSVNANVVSTVDAFNEIYGRDIAVNFSIVANPRLYSNPGTDPFTPDGLGGAPRPSQAGLVVESNFAASRFDIGHVFHRHENGDGWSNGGVAQLASVCRDNTDATGGIFKARGWSGAFSNVGVGWINLAAHEVGHMFNCPHTFNGGGESCEDAISLSTAYEIASGTTIMSYNGICVDGQNIPSSGEADNYFHANSLLRMISFIHDVGDCAAKEPTNNTPPDIDADFCNLNDNYTIPVNTPFILRGQGTDADGDQITYVWEQYDEDGFNVKPTQGFIGIQAANSNVAPLFRSFPPSTTGNERYFPSRNIVMSGTNDFFEVLPRRQRTLHFQLVARDNNPAGGGTSLEEIAVNVSSSGPLSVTAPNGTASFSSGQMTNVTWNTGGSDNACSEVEIVLSVDGGLSFPYTLAQAVQYASGSASVVIPGSAPNTEDAKIMVRCSDNSCIQFYNVSAGTFDIQSQCGAVPNLICDTDPIALDQGDPGLDLDVITLLGEAFNTLVVNVNSSDPNMRTASFNPAGGCVQNNALYRYKTVPFAVETGGNLRIRFTNWQTGGVSIHRRDNFDPTTPCPSAIASTYIRTAANTLQVTNIISADLEPCTEYLLVYTTQEASNTMAFEDLFAQPDDLIRLEDLEADYMNTYILVNAMGRIAAVSGDADFTTAPSGTYQCYSVNYKASGATPPVNSDPATWVGLNLSTLFGQDDCIQLSSNTKPVEIISSCNISGVQVLAQSDCSAEDNTYDQTISITYELPPTSGQLVVNGQRFPIGLSPQQVTLTGLNSDGQVQDLDIFFEDNPGCRFTLTSAFASPENCCPLSVDLPNAIDVCEGEMVSLDAGSDGTSYFWSLNGLPLTDITSQIAATESGKYQVTVTTDSGCPKSDSTFVNFFAPPSVGLVANDTVACEGEVLTLLLEGASSEDNIQWSLNGSAINGATADFLDVNGSGDYSATVVNRAGCGDTVSQVITFNIIPTVELGQDLDVCGGDTITLDAGDEGISYIWFRNGSTILGQTNQTIQITQSGQYSVAAEGGDGCDGQDDITLSFFDRPMADLGSDTAICAGEPITIFTNPQNVDNFTLTRNGTQLTVPNLDMINIVNGGTYELTIENEIGCPETQSIIVVENDLPVVDLDPTKLGCEGSDVLLESPLQGSRYEWRRGNMVVGTEETLMTSIAGTYTLTVADAFGCEGSGSIEVSFVPGPSLTVEGDESACEGDAVILTATTNGTNIQWSRDGNTLPGSTQNQLTVTESGTYTAAVTGDQGCIVEDQIEVIIFENPTVVLDAGITICEGDSETIMPTTTGMGLTYEWTRNGMPFSNMEMITVDDGGLYNLVVTNSNGCTADDEIAITISTLPTVEASTTQVDICEGQGQNVSLTTALVERIEWYRNGELIEGASGNNLDIITEGNYQVIVYNANGCTSTTMISASSRPTPVVDLGENMVLCPGESITLDPGSHSTYAWSDNSTGGTLLITNPDLNTTTTQNYSVTVTNEFACSNSDMIELTFRPIIEAAIEGSDGVCLGDTIQLMATGGLTYVWSDPNGSLSSTNQSTTMAFPTSATTYSVTVSDDCPGNQDIANISVEIFSPEPTSAGADTVVIIGQSIQLAANGGIQYQWASDPTLVSGANTASPTIMPQEPTTYIVTITDLNGCRSVDSVSVSIIDDPLAGLQLVNTITPNDDGDNDFLEFKGLEFAEGNELIVYNRWGNIVYRATNYQIATPLWNGTKGGEPLPADTYYYILKFGGETYKSALTIFRN